MYTRGGNLGYEQNSAIPPVVAPHIYPEPLPYQYQQAATEEPGPPPEVYVAPPQIIRVIKSHQVQSHSRPIHSPRISRSRHQPHFGGNELIETFRIIEHGSHAHHSWK